MLTKERVPVSQRDLIQHLFSYGMVPLLKNTFKMTDNRTQAKGKMSLFYNMKPVPKKDKTRRVIPSVYNQEMFQSTEERLANTKEVHTPRILELLDMTSTTYQKLSTVDLDQALFQPYPSEMIFQNFTPSQTYKLQLRLVNMDKVPRRLKLALHESKNFHVVSPEGASSKVAPSRAVTLTVFFHPHENRDYHHRLVFMTDRERFEVPVSAIGPRAVLNFRDELHFPLCPVKASTERTQQVLNIGNITGKFKLHTQRPFSVMPPCGTLEVNESIQVVVSFNPMTTGQHREDLLLHYHTGEDVYISLHGVCEELDIHLKPESVALDKTYISLVNVHKVSLTNTSDTILQYHWSVWPSREEEDLSILMESSLLQQIEEDEREQLLLEYKSDPTAIHRLPLLARALQYDRGQAPPDHLTLAHSCTTLQPAAGEIWPQMTQTFNIFFKPNEAKLYTQTIYCDITGRQSRLPLSIKGEGMGPKLLLNYNQLDMKNVFIGDRSCYEVMVSNKGLIDAPFKLSCPDTTFGHCFSFSPEEGVIPFGSYQSVKITFQSHNLGTFSEDILLTVKGQPKPLTLTFRGCVVCPTFHFDVSELNFGDVPFGFPQTLTFTLFNTSFVPMNFALRVLGDGLGSPSVTCAIQVSEVFRNNWEGSTASDPLTRPMEFSISPAQDCVCAMSDVTINVTLCSNTVRTYRVALVVDMEGVGKEIGTLPINARCVVPAIVVDTPELQFQRCFLSVPYEHQVQLTNPSSLPACYGVLDQRADEFPSLLFYCSTPRGVILPQMSVKLHVTLLAKATGRLHHTLRIALFGCTQPPLEVDLSFIGQGPVVHIESPQLDFGRIPVLVNITRTLNLSNHSPIRARFTTHLGLKKSFWHVDPSEGEVAPQSQVELRVVAHLRDTITFHEKLEVSIRDSQTHVIPLSGTGTGTTIVSDKPFAPRLHLGQYFSPGSCQYHFKLTNHGLRTNWLYWGIDGLLPHVKPCTPKKKDVQSLGSSAASKKEEEPVFSLTPSRVKLLPGCSVDMVLKGSSDSAKVVQERLVCRGVVGERGCNEQLMTVDVICHFVAPLLSLSSKYLSFCFGKIPGESLQRMYKKLVLKNISSLPVSINVCLEEPFSLCEAPETQSSITSRSMVLDDDKQADLWICFNPDCCDRVSRVVNKFLEVFYPGQPQQDRVELRAEVHFPNLHFSSTTVDFGCVLNYTETLSVITMTNCSQLPVSYRWAYLEDREHCTVREADVHQAVASSRMSIPAITVPLKPWPSVYEQSRAHCPVRAEEVFDVLPMYGHLQPGEKQLVTVSFYGHEHIKREVVAQCHVEEGPIYQIKLRGEASVISYSIDSAQVLDTEKK